MEYLEEKWKLLNESGELKKKITEKAILLSDMMVFCEHCNLVDNFTPDWSDVTQEKYGLHMANGKVGLSFAISCNDFVFGLSVKTSERAYQLLEKFDERINALY